MSNTTEKIPGRPTVVDIGTWQTARDKLLVHENAHTREGDAIAAARRRLPMVEIDGSAEVVGAEGEHITVCLCEVDRVFLTYSTTARKRTCRRHDRAA